MAVTKPQEFREVPQSALSEVEEYLKTKFSKDEGKARVQSDARAPSGSSARVDQLLLKDEDRAKLPETKDKYLVKENPHLVAWEREVRKFLRKLNPQHGHRVSAVMIYEWATGIKVAELYASGGQCGAHTRQINRVLTFYFGKPYMTYILGRKVPKAYRVPPGWYVTRHRPMTLNLWFEYTNGVLYP